MPDYRRRYRPGGYYFFTVVTHLRQPILTSDLARRLLREAITLVKKRRPFDIEASVLLPDHLHAIWHLPPGDTDYSTRWRRIKEEFTRAYLAEGGAEAGVTVSRKQRHHRGIWQRRFWEHTIDGDEDYAQHFDYIHYNPRKHRLVTNLADWPWSTYHQAVRDAIYPPSWGNTDDPRFDFKDLDQTAME